MEIIKQSIENYKTLWTLLPLMIALTVFMMVKAGKAVRKTNEEKEKLKKRLDRMKMLKERYENITQEQIENDGSEMLMEGVAANIQFKLEKTDDMNGEFLLLNEERKMVYALNYFLEEASESPREFFRNYQRPLTPYAVKAAGMFIDSVSRNNLKKLFDMYDEENDGVSFNETQADELDLELKNGIDINKIIKIEVKKGGTFFGR